MTIEKMILEYIKNHPGASAKKILSFFESSKPRQFPLEKNDLQGAVYKKLRVLKKERKLHNNRNSWYIMSPK